MDIKTFYYFYNLEEITVEKIFIKDNKFNMILNLNVYIELMANGCRPVIDMDMRHLFIFSDYNKDVFIDNPIITNYKLNDDSIEFMINNELIILNGNVEIVENYQ